MDKRGDCAYGARDMTGIFAAGIDRTLPSFDPLVLYARDRHTIINKLRTQTDLKRTIQAT